MSGRRRWVTRHAPLFVLAAAVTSSGIAAGLYGLIPPAAPDVRSRDAMRDEPARDDSRVTIPTEGLPRKGAPPEATRVTMLVCSDFECPFSKRASGTVDELLARNDDLAFYHVHLPLGLFEHSRLKARAAVAAQRQAEFWRMHDALYDARVESEHDAIELARRLGLDPARFETDLRDPTVDAEVARQRSLCTNVGVRAVPTFFINGRRLVGSQPIEAFQRLIDEERP